MDLNMSIGKLLNQESAKVNDNKRKEISKKASSFKLLEIKTKSTLSKHNLGGKENKIKAIIARADSLVSDEFKGEFQDKFGHELNKDAAASLQKNRGKVMEYIDNQKLKSSEKSKEKEMNL